MRATFPGIPDLCAGWRFDERFGSVRNEETQKSQVDAETTARVIAEKRIGERIKRLRLKKSMGLVELGKHTGLSASFLSQLGDGPRGADAAQPGADRHGLLQGSVVFL